MGERAIENRAKKLQELEEQISLLQEEANRIKGEFKADMEQKQVEEIKIRNFTIRWQVVSSTRFDTKAFKAEQLELYTAYSKVSTTRRFALA